MKSREQVLEDVYRVFGSDAIVLHTLDHPEYTGSWRKITRGLSVILQGVVDRCKS